MAGLQQIIDEPPDVVVLDLGLPDIDGRQVLRMLRAVSAVPVIVATARDDEAEIVATLDAGADDYIVKPYSATQLDARIRAVLRRSPAAQTVDRRIEVGGLRVDPSGHEATLDGAAARADPQGVRAAAHLAAQRRARRHQAPAAGRHLAAAVTAAPTRRSTSTSRGCAASWARRAAEPRYIHTIRGVGVKLVDPDE